MPYNPRSLDELGASVRGAIRRYLTGTDATLKQAFVWVSGKVWALKAREYELRLEWIFKQLFTRTTTDLAVLRMQGADLVVYQKGAAAAGGTIVGTGQAGLTYPAGVRWLSAGATYVSTAPFTAAGDGSFSAAVQAETIGAVTNRDAGAVMTLADPSLYPTLSQEAEVGVGGIGGGADVEGVESLKGRILRRKAQPPQGGALPDYERFALEVPGVLKAWAFQFVGGLGSISVFFLFAGRTNLIPEPGDVAAVQAHIDSLRMIRVDDTVAQAPIADPVNITIADLVTDTPEVRAAIEANVDAMFLARVKPGVTAEPFTLDRSWIGEAISTAAGEDSHTLVLPATNLTFTGGHLAVRGTVTYA
ncbi:baseplate J/gp47 family protein [Aquabacter sp. CN5-332]|uniref:baseplate J/gp47 family protein n=1 Tax=Aquabacter sp. CN5-332 TaxID=3156608 RepID=UPI0032B59DBF